MVRDEVLVGWTEERINKARRGFLKKGYLIVVHQGWQEERISKPISLH
jgi:hypothetical protein